MNSRSRTTLSIVHIITLCACIAYRRLSDKFAPYITSLTSPIWLQSPLDDRRSCVYIYSICIHLCTNTEGWLRGITRVSLFRPLDDCVVNYIFFTSHSHRLVVLGIRSARDSRIHTRVHTQYMMKHFFRRSVLWEKEFILLLSLDCATSKNYRNSGNARLNRGISRWLPEIATTRK